MITVRPARERGHTQLDWLDSRHTFSFGGYHDPRHMGFRALRVINEDRVKPSQGFGTHSHRDMEIITFVLEGALEHRDSLGSGAVLRPGEVQVMSAGTGIQHSEFNPSPTDSAHFLQIWILPEKPGLPPRYDQRMFSEAGRGGRLRLVASGDGRDDSLAIHQDAAIYVASLAAGQEIRHRLAPRRHAWLQVARGTASLDETALEPGDGAAASGRSDLVLRAGSDAEILLFDLA